ncbi:hypothetical protein [Desulfomarina sp.]
MKPHRFKHLILSILVLFFLSSTGNATGVSTPVPAKNAIWTWADQFENQHAVFLSRQSGDKWEEPVKISNNEALNVVPAVTRTTTGDLWVVWSAFDGHQSFLLFKRFIDNEWTEETTYYTGLSSNTAPSVVIDNSGTVWLVWAGFDGISDEIFYATWNGTEFGPAISITSNDVPDILPVLGFDRESNSLWIQWKQFSKDGYIPFHSSWTGTEWSEPTPVSLKPESANPVKQIVFRTTAEGVEPAAVPVENQQVIDVPPFVSSPESASIHIPDHEIQSLPLREMNVITD